MDNNEMYSHEELIEGLAPSVSERTSSPMKTSGFGSRLTWLLAGAALGAVAMYLLDPEAGSKRRITARKKALRLKDDMSKYTGDFTHRAQDFITSASGAIKAGQNILH